MRQLALACTLAATLLPGPATAAEPTRGTFDIYQGLKEASRKDCTTWATAYLKKMPDFGPHQRESQYASLFGECLSTTRTYIDALDDGLHMGTIKRARFWVCLDRLRASPSGAMPQSEIAYLFTCATGSDPALPNPQ